MNTIIEKIRAEVENLKIGEPICPEADGYNMAIADVLSVLSDLEKEEKSKHAHTAKEMCKITASPVRDEFAKSQKGRPIHSERDYDEWNNERSNESYMDWYNKNLLGE